MAKFYSVRCGRTPGVYTSWDDCLKQVSGFSGAVYKSFSTREEAEDFLRGENTLPAAPLSPSCQAEFYVDGSFCEESGEYSFGMVVLTDGEELCLNGKFDDPELAGMRNVAGEIRGAQEAMQFALEQGLSEIAIYHDYAGIAFWCTGAWKASKPGTVAYRDFYESIKDILTVHFVKVKGHSHNHYNDLADALAKQALGIGVKENHENGGS